MVEQLAVNETVPGSSPGSGAKYLTSIKTYSKILLTSKKSWIKVTLQ